MCDSDILNVLASSIHPARYEYDCNAVVRSETFTSIFKKSKEIFQPIPFNCVFCNAFVTSATISTATCKCDDVLVSLSLKVKTDHMCRREYDDLCLFSLQYDASPVDILNAFSILVPECLVRFYKVNKTNLPPKFISYCEQEDSGPECWLRHGICNLQDALQSATHPGHEIAKSAKKRYKVDDYDVGIYLLVCRCRLC